MRDAIEYVPNVDGARLLDDVRDLFRRFVAFPSEASLHAVVLWVMMTHVVSHMYVAPRLALLSPEPASGKTRVLEILALVSANAMSTFNASPAVLYRMLAEGPLTVLLDEVDAFLGRNRGDDTAEAVRSLLNAGYRSGGYAYRYSVRNQCAEKFHVFAPVALAGLGRLPETIMTRSIVIPMRRRAGHERVDGFVHRRVEPLTVDLRTRLEEWAALIGAEAGRATPPLPPGVTDRAAELWEPLLAVADAAGGHWPGTARAACTELVMASNDRVPSLGVRLLHDLHGIYGDRDTMSTEDILAALHALDEAPWGDFYGKPLAARGLARLLKPYSVTSKAIKIDGRTLKGYRRDVGLWDAWIRYVPGANEEQHGEPEQPSHRTVNTQADDYVGGACEPSNDRGGSSRVADSYIGSNGAQDESVNDSCCDDEQTSGRQVALVAEVALRTGVPADLLQSARRRASEYAAMSIADAKADADNTWPHAKGAPDAWSADFGKNPSAFALAIELLATDSTVGTAVKFQPDQYLEAAIAALREVGE